MIKVITVPLRINDFVSMWYMDSDKLMYRYGLLIRESYSSPEDSGVVILGTNYSESSIVFYY